MRLFIAAIMTVFVLTGCSSNTADSDFVIAAAADLRYAIDDLVLEFREQHPEAKIVVSYGSSGQFATQIEHGAPFDVFCSADLAYPRGLIAKGLALPDSEFLYAVGRIVIWVPSYSSIPVGRLGMESLRAPSVRYVAIANPDHAPYGKAAVSAMQSLGVYESVKEKLTYGENVAETLQYIQTGTADIGIVALSLALTPPIVKTGRYWEIPISSYPKMEQGGVILKSTQHLGLAQDFRSFMLSAQAREVLKRYGFYLPSH